MKKGTFLSILALLIAAVGIVVALLAYFGKKKCILCDDFDDFEDDFMSEEPSDLEYYAADLDDSAEAEGEPADDSKDE